MKSLSVLGSCDHKLPADICVIDSGSGAVSRGSCSYPCCWWLPRCWAVRRHRRGEGCVPQRALCLVWSPHYCCALWACCCACTSCTTLAALVLLNLSFPPPRCPAVTFWTDFRPSDVAKDLLHSLFVFNVSIHPLDPADFTAKRAVGVFKMFFYLSCFNFRRQPNFVDGFPSSPSRPGLIWTI